MGSLTNIDGIHEVAAVGSIQAPEEKSESDSLIVRVLRIVFLLLLIGGSLYLLIDHRQWFENPRSVKTEVTSWGVWGPAVYVLLFAVGPSFLVPGAVMTVAGGLAFGALWGALWSLVGANLGALLAFAAGRILGKNFVENVIGRRFRQLVNRIVENGFFVILYLRIVPVIPYNALNLLAGASPITFSDYFWASLIGMIPGTILFAFLGDALWHPTSPRFVLAVGLILCSFAAGETYRRLRKVPVDP